MLISISSLGLVNANNEDKVDNNILKDIHENGEARVIIVYKQDVNKDSALSMMSTLSLEKDNKHRNLNSADEDVDFKIRRKYDIINGV